MTTKKYKSDRHDPNTIIIRAWLPRDLRNDFYAACATDNKTASEVLRSLIREFINSSAEGSLQ